MLYYDRIDVSKGIDPAKNNNSKECIVCHFLIVSLNFKILFCNGCHDLMMSYLSINNIAIIPVN